MFINYCCDDTMLEFNFANALIKEEKTKNPKR